jgi:hypothetical protein
LNGLASIRFEEFSRGNPDDQDAKALTTGVSATGREVRW